MKVIDVYEYAEGLAETSICTSLHAYATSECNKFKNKFTRKKKKMSTVRK